jgi:hypothetical protein
MLFSENRSEYDIENMNPGEGYIKIGGEAVRKFYSFRILIDDEIVPKRTWNFKSRKS